MVHDALYLSFFAQIQSGPLSRYNEMERTKNWGGVTLNVTLFSEGIYRFLIGFNKKILISNVLANITREDFAIPVEDFSRGYAWLGEQGRKVAESYVGLDDYTEVVPNFDTNFTFINGDGTTWNGTFNNFINESVYNTENDVYQNQSWHYSYSRLNCINNNVEQGKILMLVDSYDHVTEPFLALGVHSIDTLLMRDFNDDFSLRDYILKNKYDTVLISYAQFMVGAHDRPESATYRMFTFEY